MTKTHDVTVVESHGGDALVVDPRTVGGMQVKKFVAVTVANQQGVVLRDTGIGDANEVALIAADSDCAFKQVDQAGALDIRDKSQFRHAGRLANRRRTCQTHRQMSNYWLLKTEPGTYSYADLERDRRTTWDGVSNAVALKHLRAMRRGDLAFIYHTGDEKQIVGVAEIASDPYPDPKANDPKLVVVDLKPHGRLAKPVTLATVKSRKEFADFELVRIGRLSVMPVSPARWKRLQSLAG